MDGRLVLRHSVTPLDGLTPYVLEQGTFEELYRREYPSLVAVARALTGDYHDSEDLVHDTMVKAFLSWHRIRSYDRPGAWCLRVLTNACRGRWRRQQTARRFLDRTHRADAVVEGPSVELLAFWEAVRRLPPRPRLVVTLFYAGDRSVAEIASITAVPAGTVKSDLARARAVLVAELER